MRAVLTLFGLLLLSSCQSAVEDQADPPHPANNRKEVVEQRAAAQHQLDDAMIQGLKEKPRLLEVQRATSPTIPYDHIGTRTRAFVSPANPALFPQPPR